MRSSLLSLSVLLCLTGCGSKSKSELPGYACTASINPVPAVRIDVRDALTDAHISCGSQAVIEQGKFQETVQNPAGAGCYDDVLLEGAYERPGIYTVTVTKPGYGTWSKDNVAATTDLCGVIPVTLKASLQPL